MKLTRKIISAALAAILIFALVFSGCAPRRGDAGNADTAPAVSLSPQAETDAEEFDEHPAAQTFREATLYYISDDGFVVPVKKAVPWEEGIAKACLGCITSSADNDAYAARLGLNTVLPAGTEVKLSISGGEARLDLVGLTPFEDAECERRALTAVINTLCEFSTVDTVTITRNGESGTLEHGTALPYMCKKRPMNAEQTELSASAGAVPRTLYFPNLSGALEVPVTRWFGAEPSLYSTVQALIEGPQSQRLMCCFPQGTLLLGAALENGVATVNLSGDFAAAAEVEGMYTLAKETLLRTLNECFDAAEINIQVNGKTFEPEE